MLWDAPGIDRREHILTTTIKQGPKSDLPFRLVELQYPTGMRDNGMLLRFRPRDSPKCRDGARPTVWKQWAFLQGARVTGEAEPTRGRVSAGKDPGVGRTRNRRKVTAAATLEDHVWFVGATASQRDLQRDARWYRPR